MGTGRPIRVVETTMNRPPSTLARLLDSVGGTSKASRGRKAMRGRKAHPGEVTNAALASAIAAAVADCACNPSAVAALGLAAAPSYDPAQLQSLADKLDELLAAAKR